MRAQLDACRRLGEGWQAQTLVDPEWRRRGGGELQCAVVESPAGASAYALYRLNLAFDRSIQTGSVEVVEATGQSPERIASPICAAT